MKLSKYISLLQELQMDLGDLEVACRGTDGSLVRPKLEAVEAYSICCATEVELHAVLAILKHNRLNRKGVANCKARIRAFERGLLVLSTSSVPVAPNFPSDISEYAQPYDHGFEINRN